ncbi:MAG: twin-arginine translocase subunit TatC [Gammaproteobacteria bacterium]|nr:MAG: twin-arginine translocase subunit TatC [Gammaproteobacteria bacterium]
MSNTPKDTTPVLSKDEIEANEGLLNAPITEHLIELRSRLIKIFAVFLVVFIVFMNFAQELYDFISNPLVAELPEKATMIAINPTGSFMASIMVTLYVTLVITMPFILYQVWAFIAPGLYKNEKKIAVPLVIVSIILFYAGIIFAYSLLTNVLGFLIQFSSENVIPMPDVESYLSFVMKIFLAFGVTFEIPVLTLLLVISGLVSTDWLEEKRRYIIVGCFAIAAVITPPDGWTMLMLAIPMCLLFELGLILAKVLVKQKQADKIIE